MARCKECGWELKIIVQGKAVCPNCGTGYMQLADEWEMVGDDKLYF